MMPQNKKHERDARALVADASIILVSVIERPQA
jgi:hypothetical protein